MVEKSRTGGFEGVKEQRSEGPGGKNGRKLPWQRRSHGCKTLRAELFLVMARSVCGLGNGDLKWGLREVFGVEGSYSPFRRMAGFGMESQIESDAWTLHTT